MRRSHVPLAIIFAIFSLASLFVTRDALAHGMSSAYLEVTELGEGRALVRLSASAPLSGLSIATPAGCRDEDEGSAEAQSRTIVCDGGLEGRAIDVSGIGPVASEVVAQITFADGATVSRVLTADEPRWILPRASSRTSLLFDYAHLGVVHIFCGVDHLLFLAALALSVRKIRTILAAETAFTASHSITFTASALGWLHVSAAAAEACIALSLVLIALDAVKASSRGELVPARRAASLAFAFGLVHGLGFASGLAEIGLPDRAIGWALLGFAGGVEVGQVVFLSVVVLALALFARVKRLARVPIALAYVVGTTGAFLFFQRLAAVLALAP